MPFDADAVIQQKTENQIILEEARRLINEKGWIQGAYSSPRGFCIAGAVLKLQLDYGTQWRTEGSSAHWIQSVTSI